MLTLSGTLKTPAGQPLANVEIRFYALMTSSNTLKHTTGRIDTDGAGKYTVTLPIGRHRVTVRQGNMRPEVIGVVQVTENTVASSLNELLIAGSAGTFNPITDTIIATIELAIAAASTASEQAAIATAKADESLSSANLADQHRLASEGAAEAAANKASQASLSQVQAAGSEALALEWSSKPVDQEVTGHAGMYSAMHHAVKASLSQLESAASELAAQAAEESAKGSADAAELIFQQFGDQYLGPKASDPTTDNSGGALDSGDIYWNTTSNSLLFYSGAAWVAPESIATTAASNAQASAQAASDHAAAALASKEATETSESAASNSRELSKQWANNELDIEVAGNPGEYSAKHYAIKSLASANIASDAQSIATEKSGEAAQSAIAAAEALLLAQQAEQRASEQAGIATAKAGDASSSAGLAQAALNAASATTQLIKADKQSPCIVKIGASSVAVKAGTSVATTNGMKHFTDNTPVTMPSTLNAGENYGVWVKPDGTAVCIEAPTDAGPYNWGLPPIAGATLVGGFHYSLTSPGTTPATGSFSTAGFTTQGGDYPWTQAQIDKLAGVNEYSIWDQLFRPKKLGLKGFVFDAETSLWVGIYFCGTDHISDGPSRAGSNVASGTVLPKIPLAYGGDGTLTYGRCSWYEASEIAQSHGCRLLEYNEFASAALGVTEGQSLGGPGSTIPLTLRQPGYTSRIGLEQASGHAYCWGVTAHGQGGSAWIGSPNRGGSYGTPYAGLFGGHRSNAGNSGSRSVVWHIPAWNSDWISSLRVTCDHLQPV